VLRRLGTVDSCGRDPLTGEKAHGVAFGDSALSAAHSATHSLHRRLRWRRACLFAIEPRPVATLLADQLWQAWCLAPHDAPNLHSHVGLPHAGAIPKTIMEQQPKAKGAAGVRGSAGLRKATLARHSTRWTDVQQDRRAGAVSAIELDVEQVGTGSAHWSVSQIDLGRW